MKVKVLKVQTKSYYYNDFESETLQYLYPVVSDWQEITETEFYELQEKVRTANCYLQKQHKKYSFLLVTYDDNTDTEVLENASAWLKHIENEEKRRKKEEEEKKEKRAAQALARKQKQLAKLKKELGDET